MARKLLTFTDKMTEMAEEIKEAKGYPSFAAVVHAGIVDLYAKTFPSYIRPRVADEDPKLRSERIASVKKAKEDIVREEKVEIANQLNGRIAEEEGREVVIYYTYLNKTRFEQKVSLSQMSLDLLKAQYSPSREKIEQLQRDGKVDYEV